MISLEGDKDDWAVDKIANHRGKGSSAMFEIVWQSGDHTWEPLNVVKHLEALRQYYEALGISKACELPWKDDANESEGQTSESESENLGNACVRVLNTQGHEL